MTTAARIRCSVPFCGRSRAGQGFELVCERHWPAVDRALRKRLARCRRLTIKANSLGRPNVAEHLAAQFKRHWELCRDQAIERAAGIS